MRRLSTRSASVAATWFRAGLGIYGRSARRKAKMGTVELAQHQFHNLSQPAFINNLTGRRFILATNCIPIVTSHRWVVPNLIHQSPGGIEAFAQTAAARTLVLHREGIIGLFLTSKRAGTPRLSPSNALAALGQRAWLSTVELTSFGSSLSGNSMLYQPDLPATDAAKTSFLLSGEKDHIAFKRIRQIDTPSAFVDLVEIDH